MCAATLCVPQRIRMSATTLCVTQLYVFHMWHTWSGVTHRVAAHIELLHSYEYVVVHIELWHTYRVVAHIESCGTHKVVAHMEWCLVSLIEWYHT